RRVARTAAARPPSRPSLRRRRGARVVEFYSSCSGAIRPVATLRGARGAPGPTIERALRTKYTADLCAAATPDPTAIGSRASSRGGGPADGPPLTRERRDVGATSRAGGTPDPGGARPPAPP